MDGFEKFKKNSAEAEMKKAGDEIMRKAQERKAAEEKAKAEGESTEETPKSEE